ncbi:DUF4168 domain-containing protein [Microbulbifer litoralis]|uniref:DUF4168 domain-containing protein n=1 Tax=Microbulbifer litoralis TaxID=2933965 RepID=UPI002028CA63|nr:DUF4168 domain-containing protein [Microbulbifer sp. GX H0434]
MIKWTNALTALLLALTVSAGASAQGAATDSGTDQAYNPGGTAAAANFSDSELEMFAEAQDKVDKMRTSLQSTLSSTQDPQEAQKARQKANSEMLTVVQASGLTTERYNEIARAALSDPALAKKIEQME